MILKFKDRNLQRLAEDASYSGSYSPPVITSFRKKIQIIEAATDERDLYGLKSLHFEKLKGDRKGQYSIRLNKQWRLILSMVKDINNKIVLVISIEDYH